MPGKNHSIAIVMPPVYLALKMSHYELVNCFVKKKKIVLKPSKIRL